jgi:hypothetical protein
MGKTYEEQVEKTLPTILWTKAVGEPGSESNGQALIIEYQAVRYH